MEASVWLAGLFLFFACSTNEIIGLGLEVSGNVPSDKHNRVKRFGEGQTVVYKCPKHVCRQDGYCTSFVVCCHGRMHDKECGSDLFWNPEYETGTGGTCDFFYNLPDNVKEEYLNDPDCIPPSDWWQLEEERCTGKYHFRGPFENTLKGREMTLRCPTSHNGESLIWNTETLSCDRAFEVEGC